METRDLIDRVKKKSYLKISEKELEQLLSKSKIVNERDTLISDKIRVLKISNKLIFQEKSNKDEFIIRVMKDINDANKLINERMEIYDRMWDGCGCKIDYYK